MQSHAQVTVVGDSLSVGLAGALHEARPDLPLESLGVVSSGLSNPRFVDWQARIHAVAATHPSLVVIMVGMNDSGATPTPAYIAALESFLSPLAEANIPFVLISIPITDDPVRNRNIAALNALYARTAPRFGGRFVTLPQFDRRERSRDGIHFTSAGYRDLAAAVLAKLPV